MLSEDKFSFRGFPKNAIIINATERQVQHDEDEEFYNANLAVGAAKVLIAEAISGPDREEWLEDIQESVRYFMANTPET